MNRTQQVATRDQQAVTSPQNNNQFVMELESYTANLIDVLPAEIGVNQFKRVVISAVSQNPDLLYANRRSLFNACVRAALDGLLPDGREGALVVYNTEVKQRDHDAGVDRVMRMDMVQWMPMIYGIRKRMRNSGEVASFVAEAVFAKDIFRYRLGDEGFIEHEPPALDQDRGDVIGAYAIIRLNNGETIRDVLSKREIEAARNAGRAPNSPMWKNFYWEGAKKTAARRCAKQAPLSASIRRLIEREDDDDAAPALAAIAGHHGIPAIAPSEPEPQRQPEQRQAAAVIDPEFVVTDLDGVMTSFTSAERAGEAMRGLLAEAARGGLARVEGLWESNQTLIDGLPPFILTDLSDEYLRQAALAKIEQEKRTASPPVEGPAAESPGRQEGEAGRGEPDPRPTAVVDRNSGSLGFGSGGADLAGSSSEAKVGQSAPAAARNPVNAGEAGGSPAPNRASLEIPPVLKNGKPDWPVWLRALLMPKMRRQTTVDALAHFLGDNEAHLKAAHGALGREDLADLEAAIKKQWEVVGNA